MMPGAWISMRRRCDVGERALAVDGLAEGVDDPAEQAVADGHREDLAGGLDRLALLDRRRPSPSTTAPIDSSSRFSARPTVPPSNSSSSLTAASGRPDDAGDAVADLEDAADLGGLDVGREALEVLLERGGDVGGVDGQLCHRRGFLRVVAAAQNAFLELLRGGGGPSRR